MKIGIGVVASAPVAGQCKRRLLAAHAPQWTAGLYAAMLRDTLDGMQSVDAAEYTVYAPTHSAADVLARHVPAPWQIGVQPPAVASVADPLGARIAVTIRELAARADVAVLTSADAPSAPVEPLAVALADARAEPFVLLGPTDRGGAFLFATNHAVDARVFVDLPWSTPALAETIRVRCKHFGVALVELPPWYTVDEPSDVLRLLDELRRHPERAPRTAQFLVTNQ